MNASAARPLALETSQLVETFIETLARRVVELTDALANEASEGESPWLDIEGAAAYLGWPRQRLYRLTASGEITHYKHGRRLLFRRNEIDAWVTTHRADLGPGGA